MSAEAFRDPERQVVSDGTAAGNPGFLYVRQCAFFGKYAMIFVSESIEDREREAVGINWMTSRKGRSKKGGNHGKYGCE